MTHSVVSLFSGCGGLDLGFQGGFVHNHRRYDTLPFQVIWANDVSKGACESYAHNIGNHIHHGDIVEMLENKEVHGFPERCDIVLGGFPCQAFSVNGKKRGFDDSRGQLYLAMRDTVQHTQPLMFVAENVKGLLQHKKGETFRTIMKDFSDIGYTLSWKLYRAYEHGIAQNRERVIVIGTRHDVPAFAHIPEYVLPIPTLKEVIGDLEGFDEDAFPNHVWSKARKNKGQGNRTLDADAISTTMRAEHHGNIEFHYLGHRRLSVREAARIQSFPDTFVFPGSASEAYKQIGNAVPPVLGWHIARQIATHLHIWKEQQQDWDRNTA